MRFPVIMAAQSSTGVSGAQAVTGVVITSATLVAAGSRRCATTRRRMSRSVKIPTSRLPSVTTNPPMPRSLMSSAALSTVSPGFTEMTSRPFRARMSWTVGMLPPPGWGFARYYRVAGAHATCPPHTYRRGSRAIVGREPCRASATRATPRAPVTRRTLGWVSLVSGDPHRARCRMTMRVVSLSIVLLTVAATAPAQSIPIQTVPLVPADQFDIFPSHTLAMGGVSIALPDTLHDPFVNPAKGARVRSARFFTSPTLYHVSRDAGAGRTLPLGVLGRAGSWFGGLAVALQQVDASHPPSRSLNPPLPFAGTADPSANTIVPGPTNLAPAPDTHGNALAFALLGTTLPGSGVSLGGSVSWAKLRALDGVDLLYPGSARVNQYGETVDARLGLLKEWEGDRSFEAIVLHERFRMTHDVTFLDTFWD